MEQCAKSDPIAFWAVAGLGKRDDGRIYSTGHAAVFPVLGSECFTDENLFELNVFKNQFVLSLDYGATGEKLGSKNIFTQPDLWSDNVIIMTLNRVGSSQGVAIDLLKD